MTTWVDQKLFKRLVAGDFEIRRLGNFDACPLQKFCQLFGLLALCAGTEVRIGEGLRRSNLQFLRQFYGRIELCNSSCRCLFCGCYLISSPPIVS